jgi:hypothetical protein
MSGVRLDDKPHRHVVVTPRRGRVRSKLGGPSFRRGADVGRCGWRAETKQPGSARLRIAYVLNT